MNETEVKKVLAVLKSSFPNFQKGIDPAMTVNVWGMMFKEDSYEDVIMAVQMYVASEKFPPAIADIREKMVKAKVKEVSAADAWGQVVKAISRYGYYRVDEALESMELPVRQLVQRMGFKDLCMSENQMADRAHFIKLWDSQMKHTKEQAMLPNRLKDQLQLNWSANDMNKAIECKERQYDTTRG